LKYKKYDDFEDRAVKPSNCLGLCETVTVIHIHWLPLSQTLVSNTQVLCQNG